MSDQQGCLFCDIISGKEKSWVVHQGRQISAILTPFPYTKGHTLIIPIKHYESMFDIPEPLLARITLAKRLCVSYEKSLRIQGVMICVLNHKLKNPKFRHFHLHVIPRYKIGIQRDPANIKPKQIFPIETDENLNRTLAKIKISRDLISFRT